jgi:serine/threonine protein kinase
MQELVFSSLRFPDLIVCVCAGGAAAMNIESSGKARSSMFALGSGSNGSVFIDHENKDAAVKRFCVRSVQHRELAVLRLVQGARGVPELIDPQPLNGVRMKRYVKPTPNGSLDVQQASQDLWAALNALWAAGFCHTDVKPDNVMYDDGTRSYVLIDFSNAVRIGSKMEYARNEFVDPAYRGRTRKATVAADQYSFLCVVRYWYDMVQH